MNKPVSLYGKQDGSSSLSLPGAGVTKYYKTQIMYTRHVHIISGVQSMLWSAENHIKLFRPLTDDQKWLNGLQFLEYCILLKNILILDSLKASLLAIRCTFSSCKYHTEGNFGGGKLGQIGQFATNLS